MQKCFWIDTVSGLELDGDDAVFTLKSADQTLLIRTRRHVALEGMARCQREYAELEAAERTACVVRFPCDDPGRVCCMERGEH